MGESRRGERNSQPGRVAKVARTPRKKGGPMCTIAAGIRDE